MKQKEEETRKIFDLNSASNLDEELIGIEALNFSQLASEKIAIPEAFVISTDNFDEFIQSNQLVDFIVDILAKIEDKQGSIDKYSKEIQKKIIDGKLSKDMMEEIAKYYKKFSGLAKTPVTVTPSSISNILSESINYKTDETELVFGLEDLYTAIKNIWSELFSQEAMEYRERIKYEGPITIAVVVMKQPVAEVSAMSEALNPLNNSKHLEIEAILGNIEPLLKAEIVGDRYVVNLDTFELLEKNVTEQKWMQVFRFAKGKFKKQKFDISEIWKSRQKLSDNQINKIALISQQLTEKFKEHFNAYFAVEMGKVVLLKVDRTKDSLSPVQVKSGSNLEILKQKLESEPDVATEVENKVELKKSIHDYVAEVEGLLVDGRDDKLLEELPKATEPEQTTKIEKVEKVEKVEEVAKVEKEIEALDIIETGADVYAIDYTKEDYSKFDNNISGFTALSGDDFVRQSGKTVEELDADKTQTLDRLVEYITHLTGKVHQTCFYTFASEAYKLDSDDLFGATKIIQGESLADIEMEAVRIVRNKMGHKHLWVSIPFVRDVTEFTEIKKMIALSKLRRSPTFKIYVSVDNAATAMLVTDIIESGVDGFIFDLDLITKNSLGIYIPQKTPLVGVKKILEHSLGRAGKRKVRSIVKGKYIERDFSVKELLKLGATDFSVEIKEIISIKNILKIAEKGRLNK